MNKQSECKAKDPSTCPYHGALIRMEQAASNKNITEYIAARDEVVALEAKQRYQKLKKLFSPGENIEVPPLADLSTFGQAATKAVARNRPSVDRKVSDQEERHAIQRNRFEERVNYLTNSEAVVTPMEAYAVWVSVYEASGGQVQKTDKQYLRKAEMFSKGNTIPGEGQRLTGTPAYNDLTWNRWTPTKGGFQIPAGYGSTRLELMVLPDVVNQNLTPTTKDPRKSWEFGHTTVFALMKTDNGGLLALTNSHAAQVKTYQDVELYRKGRTVDELVQRLTARIGRPALG